MVCAMQELATAALVPSEQQQQHHEYQQQQQHVHQHQQQQPHQLSPPPSQQQPEQVATIVLLTDKSPTQPGVTAETSSQTSRLPAAKSQQLKQQHSALVKLLESKPLTATKKCPTLCSALATSIAPYPQKQQNRSHQQQCQVVYLQQQQQHLQKISPITNATQRKRLKTMDGSDSCSAINMNNPGVAPMIPVTATNAANFKKTQSGIRLSFGDAPDTDGKTIKNDNESGVDEDVSDLKFRRNQTSNTEKVTATTLCARSTTTTIPTENYEHYQCPWKKIRYAREWKQRKQSEMSNEVQDNQQQESLSTQNERKFNTESASIAVSDTKGTEYSTTPHEVVLKETHKEISLVLQQQQQQQQKQQRRDSSDSNSSLLSNSSTQSQISLIGCTCTPQQQQQQQQYEQERQPMQQQNTCQCSDCQLEMESSCDDEISEHQLLDQTAMNYLCQKFDENLETAASGNNGGGGCSVGDVISGSKRIKKIIKRESFGEEGEATQTKVIETVTAVTADGFFRRSIQQKIQYRPCTKNQQCSILRINRNRCQYCRLKKCIAVGMSRDAVRFGRVPKREKARILAAMQQSTQNRGQQRALVTELDDQPRLLAAVLRAHLDTCEFTKEKVAAMRQRARDCPSYSMPTLLACPLNPAPELQSEQEFSQRFAHVIRGVIDFAGMIPGFQLLTQDDKFTLLKAGLFDALFVRLICMFDSSINSIICLNGQVMRRDAIQNGANARFLVDSTFNFAERMNSMNLSDAEVGLFCAIVLITPDRPGLRNTELVEKMYSRLKGCLQTIINQNRPDQPEFMAKLLETMPDLRTLSTLHTEKLVVFRTEHKELLRQQMWTMDDEQPPNSKCLGSNWDNTPMEVETKSPLGSVSSTESGDLEYTTPSTAPTHLHHHTQTSLASSAPLLAASLSGNCPLRNRANSGSSGDSAADLDIVGSHSHLTQNGLTITPIVRSHSHQQLHHHLTASTGPPQHQHRYRKLDSPTDSGIESGNEKTECKTVSSGGSSSCSSPRSSVDDALDCTESGTAQCSSSQVTVSVSPVRSPHPTVTVPTSTSVSHNSNPSTLKRQIVEDMPVLKRVLQAPPLYDTNSLMDEAYKPHKKFRALRHREFETAEADASSSSNSCNAQQSQVATSTSNPVGIPAQSSSLTPHPATSTPPLHPQPAPSLGTATPHLHSPLPHQQSQLHMHLTRQATPSVQQNLHQQLQHNQPQQQQRPNSTPAQQQHQHSTLSSTHSVLAKSLMAEPRMTPEQMKRSDIIQNYLMRDSSTCSNSSIMRSCSPHNPGSRSPAPQYLHPSHQQQAVYVTNGSSASSSTSINSNCSSPSTTTVTLASPPPPIAATRWQGHSVITTTSNNQRQQSISPSSNGSSSSSSTSSSSGGGTCQYFQSPHSTSVSPPRPSPSALHSPRLLELKVDIADTQQPLNLSKKSPTPPPSKLQAMVAAVTAAHKYPTLSAGVTVTATSAAAATATQPTTSSGAATNTQQVQVHKVKLEV